MGDRSAIEKPLHRFVAHLLESGAPTGSLGLELLTLGMVMLTKEEYFRQIVNHADHNEWSPRDSGYSALG